MTRILMPLPDLDFDTSEVAIPWKLFTEAGPEVVFATEAGPDGPTPACDPKLLTGVVFGKLGARADAIDAYRELEAAPAFRAPLRWRDLRAGDFDAIFLPGGHAPGMKQYLGSDELQRFVGDFWATGRPVGAICHGVLVLARTKGPGGDSVLSGRRTTCLPKYMERSAYLATFWKLGRYYRTYPAYVQDEVTAALGAPDRFVRGPRVMSKRGTRDDDRHAFVVEDGNYVSARWPGDSYLVAKKLLERLTPQLAATSAQEGSPDARRHV